MGGSLLLSVERAAGPPYFLALDHESRTTFAAVYFPRIQR